MYTDKQLICNTGYYNMLVRLYPHHFSKKLKSDMFRMVAMQQPFHRVQSRLYKNYNQYIYDSKHNTKS
jgi:hypothetical protein